MYNESEIEAKVKKTFPDFVITPEMEGLPTVIFSFLSADLILAITNNNSGLISRYAGFINNLSEDAKDRLVSAALSEIFLGLYTSKEVDYIKFKEQLSELAIQIFDKTVEMWNTQKQNID